MTCNYDFTDKDIATAQDYSSQTSEIKKTQSTDEVCRAVMEYVDSHIRTIKKLSSLGEVFGYNYCYLSYLFKKSNGFTLATYCKEKRLTEARKLLEQNNRVGEVAEMLNYSSLFSFSKAYKCYWGVPPNNHRK